MVLPIDLSIPEQVALVVDVDVSLQASSVSCWMELLPMVSCELSEFRPSALTIWHGGSNVSSWL